MRQRAVIGALLLFGVGVVLGTTVFRTDIAQATGLGQPVTVDNTPDQAVPMHEQGTASVKGTVSGRPAAPASPWSAQDTGTDIAVVGPSSQPINLTSLTLSDYHNRLVPIALYGVFKPGTATTCLPISLQGDRVVWHAYFRDTLTVSFPTPLQITPPAGMKACLYSAGDPDDPHVISASGFYGR